MNKPHARNTSQRGFYSENFIKSFRAFFIPISRFLMKLGVTPNAVTYASAVSAITAGVLLATNHIWSALALGFVTGFMDIIDGQLAKEFGGASRFGAVLDSTIDRYAEFFVFVGFAVRYHLLGRDWCVLWCAFAFLGSVMVSYIKSRAESEGFDCKVGKLQRPERLTIMGVGILFRDIGIDVMIIFLALFTQLTALKRLIHVYHQQTSAEKKLQPKTGEVA